MLTFPEPASASAEHEEAIDRLKGMENPFESLVRPQRGDPRFRDLDVPALLSEPRNLLLEVILIGLFLFHSFRSELQKNRLHVRHSFFCSNPQKRFAPRGKSDGISFFKALPHRLAQREKKALAVFPVALKRICTNCEIIDTNLERWISDRFVCNPSLQAIEF